MLTVGVPRALLYHRYGQFWETWLTELGFQVKVSRATTKRTVEQGLGKVSSEVCLPIKIMAGHIEELKNSVDYLLVPRMVWMQDQLYACPKMIGITDLARLNVPRTCKVIAPTIKGDFALSHLRTGLAITHDPFRSLRAYRRAACKLTTHPAAASTNRQSGFGDAMPHHVSDDTRFSIALISHFYNLGDSYVAHDIVDTLTAAGIRICTKEDLPDSVLRANDGLASSVRWVYERELYNAFRFYSGREFPSPSKGEGRGEGDSEGKGRNERGSRVDGICAVVSFGCGPDSLIVELMRYEAKQSGVPFTQLVIDEHTGKAGIVTRLEAFIDTIARRSFN